MKNLQHILLLVLLLPMSIQAQSQTRKTFYSMQYAGSVGFLSGGIHKLSPNEKVSAGLVYGFTPKSLGGPLGSLSLKLQYTPFSIKINPQISIEPIQAGIFLTQNFGKNIDFKWGQNYPKGYYWWGSSFRQHLFFSTQATFHFQKSSFSKISIYLEANTNDLYIYSYFPNMKTMNIYDIFFLGAGTRFYIREKKAYPRQEL